MQNDTTTAVHAITESGEHIVGIGDLRVILTQEGDYWYAQGLEIDYVAQGDSMEAAKENFEIGLTSTLHENLKIHGTIEPVLIPAPVEVWKERLNPESIAKRFTHIFVHQIQSMQQLGFPSPNQLPFQGIQYLQAVN